MKAFVPHATPLPGVVKLVRQMHTDSRGGFARLFCARELREVGWAEPVVQLNASWTAAAGTVRGLHFQRPPAAEAKLVSCLQGEIWDVVVDVRAGSPTFLRWHAEPLSGARGESLLIPMGFAHGFQALSDNVELIYCHTHQYEPTAEDALRFDDPALAISWPLPVRDVSDRDASHPWVTADFLPVVLP